MTVETSTRNPPKINVNTEKRVASKLATPGEKHGDARISIGNGDFLPELLTEAETRKQRDEEQIEASQIAKKKMKNFSTGL